MSSTERARNKRQRDRLAAEAVVAQQAVRDAQAAPTTPRQTTTPPANPVKDITDRQEFDAWRVAQIVRANYTGERGAEATVVSSDAAIRLFTSII